MQAVDADQAGLQRVVGEAAQAQPLRHDLAGEAGARDRARTAVGKLPLAQVAVEIADAHLVGPGARARPGAADRDAIGARLAKIDTAHVEHAVGRDVGRRILDLVEKLLGAR